MDRAVIRFLAVANILDRNPIINRIDMLTTGIRSRDWRQSLRRPILTVA